MTSGQFLERTRQARFHNLMNQYRTLHESGKGDTDQAFDILAEAMTLAPPEIKQKMDAKIEELWGPMPTAGFCDEDGNPCYSVQQVEAWLGRKISRHELDRFEKKHELGAVHRIQ